MIKQYKPGDTLLKVDYDNIKNKLNNLPKSSTLEEGKTVYFNKAVQTSRTEFKKQYPTNKIVHDLSKANYYITNSLPYITYYFENGLQVVATLIISNDSWRSKESLNNLNLACILANTPELKFIFPENIKFKSSNTDLPEEMIERITLMLKSSDQETFNLGWTILWEYDHSLNRDKFLVILANSHPMSYYRRKKSRIIEQKLKILKTFYPNKNF
jgi:hypothetical protein